MFLWATARLAPVALAILMVSCATAPRASRLVQRTFSPLSPSAEAVALPASNVESTVEVGDTMIQRGTRNSRPAIHLSSAVRHQGFSIYPYTIQIPAGVLIATGTTQPPAGTFFQAQVPLPFRTAGVDSTVRGGIFLPENGHPEVYWHATDTGAPLVDPLPSLQFEAEVHEEWKTDAFRRELIYNGRSGSTVKLLYREFLGDQIRPAFSQEASYDLAQGETIGFKGARFQIVDADNVEITYIVLQHFD